MMIGVAGENRRTLLHSATREGHRFGDSISPDGRRGYTSDVNGRWAFTSDWDAPRVAVFDTKADTPFATRPTPDGRWLLVAESKNDKGCLEVIDLNTMKATRTFELDGQPFGIFVPKDFAYLSCLPAKLRS